MISHWTRDEVVQLRTAANAGAVALAAILLEVQWGSRSDQPECPCCKRFRQDGHTHDCKIGLVFGTQEKL